MVMEHEEMREVVCKAYEKYKGLLKEEKEFDKRWSIYDRVSAALEIALDTYILEPSEWKEMRESIHEIMFPKQEEAEPLSFEDVPAEEQEPFEIDDLPFPEVMQTEESGEPEDTRTCTHIDELVSII